MARSVPTADLSRSTTIRPAGESDLIAVGWLLARAVGGDPVAGWLVPGQVRNTPVLSACFEVAARDALSDGAVYVVVDRRDGPVAAAIWFDRTSVAMPSDDLSNDTDATAPDPRLERIFGPDASRWSALADLLTAGQPVEAHQHLFAVGVHPDLQGYGIGSHLLRACHERVGQVPAYAVATSVPGRHLLLRCGYADLSEPLQIPDGPPLWPLWRPADAAPLAVKAVAD